MTRAAARGWRADRVRNPNFLYTTVRNPRLHEVFTAGQYTMSSMYLNNAGIQAEPAQ